MIGNLGGMVNVLYTLLNFICYYLNQFFFTKTLMKFAFTFKAQNAIKKSDSKIKSMQKK
jgi:hypothetical protein